MGLASALLDRACHAWCVDREQPFLTGGGRADAASAVLIFHGGREHSTTRTSRTQTSYLRMLDFYLGLRRQSRSCATYLVRFRLRGWNPEREVPDPVADARWAIDEVARRHPDAALGLLGHSMGGRTAFAVSGDPRIVGVCALAPWLPTNEPLAEARAGIRFVIAHGTSDRMTSAPLSLVYAEQLRAAGADVARFEFPGARHALLDAPALWHRFAVRTTLGLVGDAPLPGPVAAQFDTRAASDLSTDLKHAFGSPAAVG